MNLKSILQKSRKKNRISNSTNRWIVHCEAIKNPNLEQFSFTYHNKWVNSVLNKTFYKRNHVKERTRKYIIIQGVVDFSKKLR